MIHSWRGKQFTSSQKEENTHITRFENYSEEMTRVSGNGREIGLLQAIRLQTFGGLLPYSCVLLAQGMEGLPLRIWDAPRVQWIGSLFTSALFRGLICERALPFPSSLVLRVHHAFGKSPREKGSHHAATPSIRWWKHKRQWKWPKSDESIQATRSPRARLCLSQ